MSRSRECSCVLALAVTTPETRGRALLSQRGEECKDERAWPRVSIEISSTTCHKLIPVRYVRQPVWGYPKHRAIIINGSRRLDGPPPLESQHTYIYWMPRTPSAVSSLSLSIVTCRLVLCISLIILIHCLSITIQS